MNTYFYRTDPTKCNNENFREFFLRIVSFRVHGQCSFSRFDSIPRDCSFEPDLLVFLLPSDQDERILILSVLDLLGSAPEHRQINNYSGVVEKSIHILVESYIIPQEANPK